MKSTCFGKKLKRILGGVIICSLPIIYYACKPYGGDEPHPNDPTPTPTDTIPDTPIIDTTTYPDTIFVPFKWRFSLPNEDTINFYKDKNGVKVILMVAEPLSDEEQMLALSQGWRSNRAATDLLCACHELAPDKARGYGCINFTNIFPEDSTMHYGSGIMSTDADRLRGMGYQVCLVIPGQSK
jgi:hypothetical protein